MTGAARSRYFGTQDNVDVEPDVAAPDAPGAADSVSASIENIATDDNFT